MLDWYDVKSALVECLGSFATVAAISALFGGTAFLLAMLFHAAFALAAQIGWGVAGVVSLCASVFFAWGYIADSRLSPLESFLSLFGALLTPLGFLVFALVHHAA